MNVFRNLFAKSPFEPLQSHMEKVAICVNKVTNLFEAYYQRDFKKLKKVAQEISELEHAADQLVVDRADGRRPRVIYRQ